MPIGSLVAVDEKRKGGETKALIDFASRNNRMFYMIVAIPCLYCKAIVASLRKLSLIRGHEFSASITQLSCIAAKKTFRFSIFENKANLT